MLITALVGHHRTIGAGLCENGHRAPPYSSARPPWSTL
ncbi:hypothetical protein GJR88_00376 [Dietzia sp. DQ12-45-1b]|nr:hypothetical protein GJR88_00376 [Dietzia sp. DQ12-45-1b]